MTNINQEGLPGKGELSKFLPVTHRPIGGQDANSVNARDLHEFLEVQKDFSDWIKVQVERARLVEHRDFEVFPFLGGNSGGRPRQEYALTPDAAKHISMMSGTEKGFEARDYFIECERQANDPVHRLLSMSRPEMLELATGIARERDALRTQTNAQAATIAMLKPKAEFADKVQRSPVEDALSFREFAKVLGTGQNRLCAWLREIGALIGSSTEPYQTYVDEKYFHVVEATFEDTQGRDRSFAKTLITGKGQVWLQRKWMGTKGVGR